MVTVTETLAPPESVFTITRQFQAPLARLWVACSNAESLRQWWGPKGMPVTHSTLDFRPGGRYHYGLRRPDEGTLWGLWEISAIEPQRYLKFLSTFSDEHGGGPTHHPWEPDWPLETLTEMQFNATKSGSQVQVRWTPVRASAREIARFTAGHEECRGGWNGTFDQLEQFLQAETQS